MTLLFVTLVQLERMLRLLKNQQFLLLEDYIKNRKENIRD